MWTQAARHMATFRNLVFKPHPSNPKYGIQAKMDLKEGYVISVVAGRHFYSTINANVHVACVLYSLIKTL